MRYSHQIDPVKRGLMKKYLTDVLGLVYDLVMGVLAGDTARHVVPGSQRRPN